MHANDLHLLLSLLDRQFVPVSRDTGAQVCAVFKGNGEFHISYRACARRRGYYTVRMVQVIR